MFYIGSKLNTRSLTHTPSSTFFLLRTKELACVVLCTSKDDTCTFSFIHSFTFFVSSSFFYDDAMPRVMHLLRQINLPFLHAEMYEWYFSLSLSTCTVACMFYSTAMQHRHNCPLVCVLFFIIKDSKIKLSTCSVQFNSTQRKFLIIYFYAFHIHAF